MASFRELLKDGSDEILREAYDFLPSGASGANADEIGCSLCTNAEFIMRNSHKKHMLCPRCGASV